MKIKGIALIGACAGLAACSAVSVKPNARSVVLANAQPSGNCRYLGEATGSQGNWFTGDYTSNANLMKGARNELRNKAAAMGGDYVWVQNQSNAHAYGSLGTDNTTVVGNVYACQNGSSVAATTTRRDSGMQASATDSRPRPVMRSGSATQVLAAQRTATNQGCGDVRNYADGEYAAKCSAGTLIIRCDGDQCIPVHMKR